MSDTNDAAKGGVFATEVPGVLSGSYEFIGKAVAQLEENIEVAKQTAVTSSQEAASSEANAAASASAAANSATAAATSLSNIQDSETNSAASEAAAALSEAAAAASETAAALSETNAGNSETAAANSAAAALVSENAAATSESNAASSESAAATSEANAATSETNAATSESNAATSEANALSYRNTADTHRIAAQAAQAAAEAAEAGAASIFDQFGDQYLGSKASDPTVDNDGDPLTQGDIYWNTANNTLRFYNGSAWVAPETIASTAATNASNSAAAALASENAAALSESNAATSESNASTSESNAAASQGAALSSQNAAALSESNASTSESNAAASEAAAALSESNAATSATNAANSESQAALSESNASTSETNAANTLSELYTLYLGTYASDPTVDGNGDPLAEGALYYNSTDEVVKVYEGATWVAAYASLSGALIAASNLSDLDSVSAARTNLGLGTGNTPVFTGLSFGSDVTMSWNVDDATVDMNYGDVSLQVGQEQHYYAKATEAISDGDVVMFAGAQGSHILIAKADMGAVGFKPQYIMGLATQNFALNDFGYVTSFGKVRNLDTSGYSEGDIIYLDPNTAGGWTTTEPTPTDHIIQLAAVVYSHATQGTVFVRPTHKPDTDEVPEGSSNLYYTDARAQAAITGGTGVTVTSGQVAIGQPVGTTSNVQFNNLVLDGNLTVNGTTTTVSTSNLSIDDNLLHVAANNAGDTVDIGWIAHYNDGATNHAGMFRDATDSKMYIFDTYASEPGNTIDRGDASFSLATVVADTFEGNATSATKLATARTLGLSGDVSGSVSFDGTANATITATVADDSHNHIISNIDGLQTALDAKVDDSQVLTNVPAGAVFTDTVYTHPSHPGDDFSVDSGPLTGATVISDIDINVTTDTLGHVTDANGVIATRNLTLADLGYTGATNANYITNNNQLTNGAGYITSSGSITGNAATATTAGTCTGNAATASQLYINNDDTGDTNCPILFSLNSTAGNKAVYEDSALYLDNTNNYVYAAQFIASSDRNLKDNIVNVTDAVSKVQKLNGVTFNWKDSGQAEAGVIAQDVLKVLPEAVQENNNGHLSVNYGSLHALLIEAIKEQQVQIDELKAKLGE